jgi:hypothetical protein
MIMVSPDMSGREADRKAGYVLGVNLGKVIQIVDGSQVKVHWWFSKDEDWSGSKWMEWYHPTRGKGQRVVSCTPDLFCFNC